MESFKITLHRIIENIVKANNHLSRTMFFLLVWKMHKNEWIGSEVLECRNAK